jgi:hypothetical protein
LLSGFGDLNVSREKGTAEIKDGKNKKPSTQVVEAKPISLALMTDKDFEVRKCHPACRPARRVLSSF